MPLLHLSSRLEDWRCWSELHEHPNDISAVKGSRYELFTMLLEVASPASAWLSFLATWHKEIDAGKLIVPIERSLPEQASYFWCILKSTRVMVRSRLFARGCSIKPLSS